MSKNYSHYYNNLISELGDLNDWEYGGGNQKNHDNYFKLKFDNTKIRPIEVENCICGHKIIEQCYIYNNKNDELKVLGNCCIKKFIPKSGRTCEDCGKGHRNRKFNKCKECVKYICFDCGEPNSPDYKYCYDCYLEKNRDYL